MNANSTTSAPKTAVRKPAKSNRHHAVQGGTSEANRQAIAILEVLAGERSPSEAAVSVGLSLVRYFQIETRALEGMVAALEPRPKGKPPSLDGRVKELEKQLDRAHRESARQQALVRIARRNFGLPVTSNKDKPGKDKTGRKKRRPVVRALKVVRSLRARTEAMPAPENSDVASSADVSKKDRQESSPEVQQESAGNESGIGP